MEWKAYVRNSSKSPVYDVLYIIHDSQDLDAALPEMLDLAYPAGHYVGLLPDMVRGPAGGKSAGIYDLLGQTREGMAVRHARQADPRPAERR